MKVYLAASRSLKKDMRTVRALLQDKGIEVTSRWIDTPEPESMKAADLATRPGLDTGAIHACKDLDDIDEADVVLVVTDVPSTTGGLHVEFGYAYAKGKRVIVCGPRVNVFQALAESYPDLPSARAALAPDDRSPGA